MTESTGWLTLAEFVDNLGGDSAYLCNILRNRKSYQYTLGRNIDLINIPDEVRHAMIDRLVDNIREENSETPMPNDSNPYAWFTNGHPEGTHHNQSRILYCLFMAEQTKNGRHIPTYGR